MAYFATKLTNYCETRARHAFLTVLAKRDTLAVHHGSQAGDGDRAS